MLERSFNLRLHLGAGTLVEIHHDGVFRRVVIVGSAGGHAGGLGDVAHGSGVVTFTAEEFERGIEYFAAGLFGFGSVLWLDGIFERVQDQNTAESAHAVKNYLNAFRNCQEKQLATNEHE